MLKFLLFVGICAVAYFCAVGFLRTAEKAGWSEADRVEPQKPTARR